MANIGDNNGPDKAQLRKVASARRDKVHRELPSVAQGLVRWMKEIVGASRIVSCYLPIQSEIDPQPLMQAIYLYGPSVCLPIVAEKHAPLLFREWHPESEMIEVTYGTLIPKEGEILVPDLIIAPLLAFDKRGTRLGYGGGYYDRTLAQLRRRNGVRYMGLAYSAQCFDEELPREKTDIALDGVLTEKGIEYFEGA